MKKKKHPSVLGYESHPTLPQYCPICDEEDILHTFGGFPNPEQLSLCKKHKGKALLVMRKTNSILAENDELRLIDEIKLKKMKFKIPKTKIIFITSKFIEDMIGKKK